MDISAFLDKLCKNEYFSRQIMHIEMLPETPAMYKDIPGGLYPPIQALLEQQGIHRLYSHQADSIGAIREGLNAVIVTGTASGKTLCYNIPSVESLMDNNLSTMLYIYPTKALAQDQLRGIGALQDPANGIKFLAGTYDGDTPQSLRRKLRDNGSIILTNPDMLHQAILPQHARWNKYFTNLKYIVIDEIHAYRGVFGSHLANVMRRLKRICNHYGSHPQFICCSATIANPKEHAEKITGSSMALIDNDGSPKGAKQFVFWNPPLIDTAARGNDETWRAGGDRRSPIGEAVYLMTNLVKEGIQTIAFVKTRLSAELIYKSCRDRLKPVSRKLAESIQAYRGGYLPEERRKIEQRLVKKEILGVASTNALELGIDIGSLDAGILVGYPGTIASLWQQAGRTGRGCDDSVIFLIGQNSPIDQYLMVNHDYIFAQNPEQAVIDPDNPHITIGHIKCAIHELPLNESDNELFGQYTDIILELLEEDNTARKIENRWYWSKSEYPASEVNLRNIAGPIYTIQDDTDREKVIGTMDEISTLSQLHNHAVYLHGADTYFVTKLDFDQKIAHVERQDLDYYTQSIQASQIKIDNKEEESSIFGASIGFGDATVTTTIPMFKKIKFHSRDSLGFEKLELPPQELETVAMWFTPNKEIVKLMIEKQMIMGEALIGIANVMVEIAPFYVMCDPQDIGTVVDSSCIGMDTLFLYDRYPGGMGYARRCLDNLEEMLATIYEVIKECGCEDGCPSCVGAAIPPFAMTDLDSAVRGRIPDKSAALFLLEQMQNMRQKDYNL